MSHTFALAPVIGESLVLKNGGKTNPTFCADGNGALRSITSVYFFENRLTAFLVEIRKEHSWDETSV
jgi:hypothetical protein